MSRMYASQASQETRNSKDRLATQAVLGELGELRVDRLRDRRVPGEYGDSSGERSDVSGEEQVAIMEKDLRDDAPWKNIQRKTFTRWVNEHLKTADQSVGSLETDLSDGLRLIVLIEVLSGKKFTVKFNKKPQFRSQKLENVSQCLAFLEEEGIKLVSIDSADIVDGRLKLILGLVWALILHYSISRALPKGEGEEEDFKKDKRTPKERLLSWFSEKLPLPVKNFTTDWNDGRACGALDNVVAPGLCPDWESWDPKDALRNATEAMNLAEKWLGVSQLIRPEDMIDPNMDEQSMMTYLAQFPMAEAKAGAPLRAKSVGNAGLVRCTGRGLQKSGIRLGDEVFFRVCTQHAGEGGLTVRVLGPDRLPVPLQVGKVSTGVHEYDYAPESPGQHRVEILFGGQHVPNSPFLVNVGLPWDSKIEASGPGLSGGIVGSSADFIVNSNGEAGMLGFSIEGPSEVNIECKDRGDLKAYVKYWPTAAGEYAVHILCGEEDIPGSPFMALIVDAPSGAAKPDVVENGARLESNTTITGPATADCVDSCNTTTNEEDGTTIVTRRETRVTSQVMTSTSSSHRIIETYTEELAESALGGENGLLSSGSKSSSQDVRNLAGARCDVTKVLATGVGLEKAVCSQPNTFIVKADAAGYNMLLVGIYGKILHPHEVLIKHLGHASYEVSYLLKERGEYLLSVQYGGIHIAGSPFVINCV